MHKMWAIKWNPEIPSDFSGKLPAFPASRSLTMQAILSWPNVHIVREKRTTYIQRKETENANHFPKWYPERRILCPQCAKFSSKSRGSGINSANLPVRDQLLSPIGGLFTSSILSAACSSRHLSLTWRRSGDLRRRRGRAGGDLRTATRRPSCFVEYPCWNFGKRNRWVWRDRCFRLKLISILGQFSCKNHHYIL